MLPPSVGSICTFNGEIFTCPGAQSLGLLEILQATAYANGSYCYTYRYRYFYPNADIYANPNFYPDGNLFTNVDSNRDTNADRTSASDSYPLVDPHTSGSTGIQRFDGDDFCRQSSLSISTGKYYAGLVNNVVRRKRRVANQVQRMASAQNTTPMIRLTPTLRYNNPEICPIIKPSTSTTSEPLHW